MFARVQKQDFPQWPRNGNATREIELDGENRFVTGREAANPGAGNLCQGIQQRGCGKSKLAASEESAGQTISVNLASLFLEAQVKKNGAVNADVILIFVSPAA